MDRNWKVIMTSGLIQHKSLFQRQYEYYNLILHTSIHCTMFTDLIYTTLNKLNYILTGFNEITCCFVFVVIM